jgi:hypothetical protein
MCRIVYSSRTVRSFQITRHASAAGRSKQTRLSAKANVLSIDVSKPVSLPEGYSIRCEARI